MFSERRSNSKSSCCLTIIAQSTTLLKRVLFAIDQSAKSFQNKIDLFKDISPY